MEFNHILSSKRDDYFPLLTKIITLCASSPWYNTRCKQAKTRCRRFERRYRKRPSATSSEAYFTALRELNATLLSSKTEYYTRVFEELQDNPRKLYATVAILKGKSPNRLLPDLARTNPLELATKFNNFLFDKIMNIRTYLDTLPTSSMGPTLAPHLHPLSEFSPISLGELDGIISRVNLTHCPLDPINFRKVQPDFLKVNFLKIINQTFESRTFPTSERKGIIYPLLKSHDLDVNVLANYRPITNVSYLSKLIENAIYEQLYTHVSTNKLLPDMQSAYRKHHSTESALTRMYSDIITNMDNHLHTIVISLDLSSAFDSIDHGILLEELSSIGVIDGALSTIKSYLEDKQVMVSIDDTISEPLPLRFGVPQGSVLGPLLFSIYTRRLSVLLTQLGLDHQIYADDTQIYCSFGDDQVLETKEKLVSALQSVNSWMTGMRLKLNLSKTNAILFSPKSKRESMKRIFGSLHLNDSVITPSPVVKILGILFDSDLSFGPQIDALVRACNFALHNLQVARDFLPRDLLISSATHDILSRIDYCNSLYLRLPQYQLYRLQKLINRAARLIYRLPRRAHITSYLRRLHWLPIGARIDFKVILMTYKIRHYHEPVYLRELLPEASRDRIFRAASAGHAIADRSFRYSAPRLFNAVPSHIRQHQTTETFKRHLKSFLFCDAYDHKLESLLSYIPSDDFVMRR